MAGGQMQVGDQTTMDGEIPMDQAGTTIAGEKQMV